MVWMVPPLSNMPYYRLPPEMGTCQRADIRPTSPVVLHLQDPELSQANQPERRGVESADMWSE